MARLHLRRVRSGRGLRSKLSRVERSAGRSRRAAGRSRSGGGTAGSSSSSPRTARSWPPRSGLTRDPRPPPRARSLRHADPAPRGSAQQLRRDAGRPALPGQLAPPRRRVASDHRRRALDGLAAAAPGPVQTCRGQPSRAPEASERPRISEILTAAAPRLDLTKILAPTGRAGWARSGASGPCASAATWRSRCSRVLLRRRGPPAPLRAGGARGRGAESPEHHRRVRHRRAMTARPTSSRSCSRARRCGRRWPAASSSRSQSDRLRHPDRPRPRRGTRERRSSIRT